MEDPPLVAFLGKGGTGKTTLSALALKYVLANGPKPVLVVDADPNTCLPELLGLRATTTIGQIKHGARTAATKAEYCEYALENAVLESTGFDLVVMGRPEGVGCYCFVNGLIHALLEKMRKAYRLVIADCEAGLEHLSRKTLGDVDTAFLVSDCSRKGMETARRQIALMDEVGVRTRQELLILNNATGPVPEPPDGLRVAGVVRHDDAVCRYELEGRSLLDLPPGTPAYADFERIMEVTLCPARSRI